MFGPIFVRHILFGLSPPPPPPPKKFLAERQEAMNVRHNKFEPGREIWNAGCLKILVYEINCQSLGMFISSTYHHSNCFIQIEHSENKIKTYIEKEVGPRVLQSSVQ